MGVTISFVSQKGGVGKSTLARSLAVVAAQQSVDVLLADLDPQQQTSSDWRKLRLKNHIEPEVTVRGFRTADDALIAGDSAELLIIDGPARASAGTLEIAEQSDLVVQPSGVSIDDLKPAVLLFHDLVESGIPPERLVVALSRSGSESEEVAARRYLEKAGYHVLEGSIQEKPGYREALNRGEGLTESKHKALADRASLLIKELMQIVHSEIREREPVVAAKKKPVKVR